jgi:tRNA pseudouridine38-40 synthase
LPNFRLVLEYDGTDFAGWQSQREGQRTVQATLEAALAHVCGAPVGVVGAGRTDAGVHAEGQVASARCETRLDAETLQRALNAVLPRDVAVREVAVAADSFHARRDALSKRYVYRIWNAPVRAPLRERISLWVPVALDVGAMREAALALVGTHDFASFQAAGSSAQSTVRALTTVALERAGAELACSFEGPGFLRHMVRNLVGTLLEVGRGRRPPDSIAPLLAARDRTLAGPTAPPHGLTLVRVEHGDFRPQSEGLEAKRVDAARPRG